MKIYIHIDRLILHGASGRRVSRHQLAELIQTEVAGQVATAGLPRQFRSSSMRSDASGRREKSGATGVGIGGALWESLNQ